MRPTCPICQGQFTDNAALYSHLRHLPHLKRLISEVQKQQAEIGMLKEAVTNWRSLARERQKKNNAPKTVSAAHVR